MFEKIEDLFWDFKRGFSSFINQFQEEEKGASDIGCCNSFDSSCNCGCNSISR